MSLVGTRPILPDELEQYELHHRARIAIKPGIGANSIILKGVHIGRESVIAAGSIVVNGR